MNIEQLHKKLAQIQQEKAMALANKQYEKAAMLRDEERKYLERITEINTDLNTIVFSCPLCKKHVDYAYCEACIAEEDLTNEKGEPLVIRFEQEQVQFINVRTDEIERGDNLFLGKKPCLLVSMPEMDLFYFAMKGMCGTKKN